MCCTDKKIKKSNEADELMLTLGISAVIVTARIAMLLFTAARIAFMPTNKEWSDKINKILKGSSWRVILYEDNDPNAFTFGTNRLFVSTGLVKMMTEREVIAVLIHEAYHTKNLHVLAKETSQWPFIPLVISVIVSAGLMLPIIWVLLYICMMKIPEIAFNLIHGRKQEYNADAHTVKYGYGDDMISALKKLDEWAVDFRSHHVCEGMCKIIRTINHTIDEHPEFKDRIENVLRAKELEETTKTKSYSSILNFVKRKLM